VFQNLQHPNTQGYYGNYGNYVMFLHMKVHTKKYIMQSATV